MGAACQSRAFGFLWQAVKYPHFIRALSSRNYRLYFIGQCISLLGNWMTTTASLWLVYQMSGRAFDVGLVGFAGQIPVLIFAPFAGVWVDRVDGLRLVKLTQVLAMLQSAALAVLTLSGHMTVPVLLWLCLAQGFINALDWPARQTLTYGLAGDRSLIENVIALNSITFNLARLVGPAIAGLVIAAIGPGMCFFVDALSYLPVLASLAALRLTAAPRRPKDAHPLTDLRDGIRYAWAHAPIRRLLLMVAVTAFAGFSHSVLAPVLAQEAFHGDARTLGYLMSTTGLGALAGGLYLSTRSSHETLDSVIIWGAAIGSAGMVGIAFAIHFSLALIAFAAAGAGGVLVMATSNTLVQTQVDDDKRGRVMGLFTMSQSLFPLGSLAIGAVADALGARHGSLAAGVFILCASIAFAWSRIRPVGLAQTT